MDRKLLAIAAAAVSLGLAACGHNPTKEQIGTVGGAVLGGAAGSAVTGGSTLGTVGGAAAGAIIGKEVGEDLDRK
jgi:osmotically inducible lipoprotein OsmB